MVGAGREPSRTAARGEGRRQRGALRWRRRGRLPAAAAQLAGGGTGGQGGGAGRCSKLLGPDGLGGPAPGLAGRRRRAEAGPRGGGGFVGDGGAGRVRHRPDVSGGAEEGGARVRVEIIRKFRGDGLIYR